MQVAISGVGRMGAQIGIEYALGGHEVTFIRRGNGAAERIDAGFALALEAGLADAPAIAAARTRCRVVSCADEAPEPEIIVESIVEDLGAKVAMLAELAGRWPRAIVASNTSSLSIAAIGAGAGALVRTIGTHYWNPPLLMPLVELIVPPSTDLGIADRMETVLRALGKRPLRVQRDVPGFVWNRLQLALVREAAWIVENGVATPEVVDEIVRDGLARRWQLTGPFETMALGGAETFTRIAANLFPVLSSAETLDEVGRWLPADTQFLAEIRRARDAGLIEALSRPERHPAS